MFSLTLAHSESHFKGTTLSGIFFIGFSAHCIAALFGYAISQFDLVHDLRTGRRDPIPQQHL